MTWLFDFLSAYRLLRSNEQARREEIVAGLAAIDGGHCWDFTLGQRFGICHGLSWSERLEQDRITLREYSGPWRPFDSGYASR